MPKHKPLCKKNNHWMEAEHKKIFINALNSDEFEQKPDFYINGTHDGNLNDNLGWTFKEIAEWVEEHIQVITPESHPLYFRNGEAIPNGH